MTQKWTRVSRRMLFTWCLLGGLICMFAPVSLTSKLQLAYTYVFSWPLQAGHSLSVASATLSPLRGINSSTGAEVATTEHQRLKNHIANLEVQLKEARQEIEHLGRVRAMPQWERMTFLRADITLPSQTQDVLYINRGQQDGVAVGQYVMGDMSIIGVVSDVSPQRAKVKLITDPSSKVPVTIGESEMARVMEGELGNVAKVPYVPASYPVSKETKVYAKKMPGRLDVPIVTAQVNQCRIDPENPSLLDITVQPVCEISGLTSVVVILSSP
jgi:cell shape-determining protein MreC